MLGNRLDHTITEEGEQEESTGWLFSEEEVKITETVLGRGAFGEVRVARWRGIDIAAKRLHDLEDGRSSRPDEYQYQEMDALRMEMIMLSKLRHPNLVLFLGICEAPDGHISTILTELMPSSLYEVLEDSLTRLSLPEVLDVCTDVVAGLDYLHSHNPPIVHRDISSKNILIGGNRAKIADLGQAKVFGANALSRQTSLPGAMAYSAPEVLTGKYSEKIDIFSFGVLVVQMASGEYPRIERRDDQLTRAQGNHLPLASMMSDCLSFQPKERPKASEIYSQLNALMANDRHYPAARRSTPQRDVGLLGRRWMANHLETTTKDVKTALEQTTRRLTAESERLRDEIERGDRAEKENARLRDEIDEAKRRALMSGATTSELEDQLAEQGTRAKQAEKREKERIAELDKANELIKAMQGEARNYVEELMKMKSENEGLTEHRDNLKVKLGKVIDAEKRASANAKEARTMLDMKDRECEDTERQLEQTLTRWKMEKDLVKTEQDRCKRLTFQGAVFQTLKEKMEAEFSTLEERLHQYDELPLPDEIKQRFTDLETDIERMRGQCNRMQNDASIAAERAADLDTKCSELQMEVEMRDGELHEKDLEILSLNDGLTEKDRTIESLREEVQETKNEVEAREGDIINLKTDIQSLEDDADGLRFEISAQKETIEDLKLQRAASGDNAAASSAVYPPPESSIVGNQAEAEASATDGRDDEGEGEEGAEGAPGGSSGRQVTGTMDVFKRGLARPDFSADPAAQAGVAPSKATVAEGPQEIVNESDELRRKNDRNSKLMVVHAVDRNGHLGLVKLIADNLYNYHVIWRACREVRDMIVKNEHARTEVVEKGLDELSLSAMAACASSGIAKAQCLRLIGVLAYGADIVRRRVGERGGIRLLLDAMDKHTEDETLQLHAFTALTNLAHNSIDNRSRFQEAQGVNVIVAIMGRHVKAMKVQRQACWALLTLAGSDEVSRNLVLNGAGSAVVNAMLEHRFDSGIQQFGAWALGNLAMAGDDVRRRLKIAGSLEVCRIAIETFPDDVEVVRQSRNTVGTLGTDAPAPKNNKK
jgi:serine/threonine protein kinase